VVNRVPPAERSSAVGTFTMSFDLAQGASGFLFGAVAAAVGYRSTFAAGAGCALVGLTLLFARVGREGDRVVPALGERAVLGEPDAWLPPGAE